MITAHITSLESKGYITKEPSMQDKRAYYIRPTNKAPELVECAKADLDHQLDRLICSMGQEAFDTFVSLADIANRILENKGE